MSRRDGLVEVDLFDGKKYFLLFNAPYKNYSFFICTADHSKLTPNKQKRHKRQKRNPFTSAVASKPASIEYDSDVVDVGIDSTPDDLAMSQPHIPFAEPTISADKPKIPAQSFNNPPTTIMSTTSTAQTNNKSQKRKKNRGKDSGTSSDEERWLDAIQSGKLEQVEQVELKKIKDPKLMTARQRAMYERGNDKETSIPSAEILMALPSGYKEKVMTAEAIQKAAIKSQKRKQLADEKREKEKKRTMERLLKKQDSRANKNTKVRPAKLIEPVVSYRSTQLGMTITFPAEYDMPLFGTRNPPSSCAGLGSVTSSSSECSMCGAPKRYNCSRTNIPLCSLKCYKLNVESLKEIMC